MQELVRFVKFGLVGVMNTAVDFAVFTLVSLAGVHYLAAQVVSYAAGTANSYVVNKFWTFKSTNSGAGATADKSVSRGAGEFFRFVLLNVGTLLLSLVCLYGLKTGLGLHELLAKLLVTGVTVVVNYVGSKLWVFHR